MRAKALGPACPAILPAWLEGKRPTQRWAVLDHVNLVLDVILGRIAANLQVAIAEPEIIQVAESIQGSEFGTEIPVIIDAG